MTLLFVGGGETCQLADLGFGLAVIGEGIMDGDKPGLAGGSGVVRHVVDVEGAGGIDAEKVAGRGKDGGIGFEEADLERIYAAPEMAENGIAAKDEVPVEGTRIGKQVERDFLGEFGNEAVHLRVLVENIFPDRDKFVVSAFVAKLAPHAGGEFCSGDVPALERVDRGGDGLPVGHMGRTFEQAAGGALVIEGEEDVSDVEDGCLDFHGNPTIDRTRLGRRCGKTGSPPRIALAADADSS